MLAKVSLFQTKRDFAFAFFILAFISAYSFLIECNEYKLLTRFDSYLVTATLQKQYQKTKLSESGKTRTYQILKFKSDKGFAFYTSARTPIDANVGQKAKLEIFAGEIGFYEYLSGFYASSKVLEIHKNDSLKERLNLFIGTKHSSEDAIGVYQALYTAKPLSSTLQEKFSALGVSHLLAISGFHLGVLSALLFFLLKYPYKFFQNRYFPYRSYKVDTFVVIALVLLAYLLFLDSPPSLLRSYAMLVVGFALYDRGVEIASMQTLALTVLLLLALFPRLFFGIGFWLSVGGVFYIFLFLISFKDLSKTWQFFLLPFWVYLLMLPYSIAIFGNFSVYHPLSILWTSLFTLFYPLGIFLHLFGFGDFFDGFLEWLIGLNTNATKILLGEQWLVAYVGLSLGAIYKKIFLYLLFVFAFCVFIYSVYQIA
jgi:competence protein ComEC